MFICPKCNSKIVNNKCCKCGFEIKVKDGIYYFSEEDNINVNDKSSEYIGYDNIAIHFEPSLIYEGLNSYGIFGPCSTDIVNRFGKDIVVLDIGCGLGNATVPFAMAGCTIIGADISEEMLRIARSRCDKEYDNLFLCKMNAYHLNLEDESVDIVVENAMIHLVDNPDAVYKEICRVLKKDGKFIHYGSYNLDISEDDAKKNKYSKEVFKDIKNYYFKVLDEYGYKPFNFYNDSLELHENYFYTTSDEDSHIKCNDKNIFKSFVKYRVHRLEHKAFSYLQNVPDDIHKKVWEKTDYYAKSKYGDNYKEIESYFSYGSSYDIYYKK